MSRKTDMIILADTVGEILVKTGRTRRQISTKLVQLGLVADSKQLRKKRSRKSLLHDSDSEGPVHIGGMLNSVGL